MPRRLEVNVHQRERHQVGKESALCQGALEHEDPVDTDLQVGDLRAVFKHLYPLCGCPFDETTLPSYGERGASDPFARSLGKSAERTHDV